MERSERFLAWVARERTSLQRGVAAGLIVVPLISSTHFFFASTFVQSVLFLVLVVVLSVVALSRYAFRDLIEPLSVRVLLAFVVALTAAAFFGGDVARSFWSTFERMWGVVMYLSVLGFVLVWSAVFRGEEGTKRLLSYASIGVVAVSVYALGEWAMTGFPSRIDGSIGNAAFLASFVLLGIFILLAYASVRVMKHMHERIVLGVVLGLATSTLLLTGTRGSWLGLFVGGIVLMIVVLLGGARDAWGMRRDTLTRMAKIGLGIFALVVVLFFPLQPYLKESSIGTFRRLGDISLDNRAVSGRLLNWSIAWEGAKERPILGWGPEQYHILYDKHYNPRLFNIEPWVDRAHNNYLDVAATSGIVGFLAYLGVLGVGLIGGWKLRAQHWAMGNAVIAGIFAYGVNAVFLFDTLWTWVPLLLLVSVPYLMKHNDALRRVSFSASIMRMVVFGFGACIVVWYGVITPVIANAYGKYAYDALARGDDAVAYEAYAKAISRETYGSVDIDRSLAEYVFDFVRKGGKRDPASLIRANEHALEAMDRNISREPANGKWWLWAGQLASLHSTLTEANKSEYLARSVTYLEGAVERMPNRAQVLLELAQVYRVQGDVARMREAFDRAVAIWPEFPLPHANAVAQYIYVGDKASEVRELSWLRGNSWAREHVSGEKDLHDPDRDMVLIRDAYYNVGRFTHAASMQNEITEREEGYYRENGDPSSLVASLQALAYIQSKAGDRAGARTNALRVLELDPDKRSEVEGFLWSIGY